MEEKPPQRAGREAPRSRNPRAAFSTPEQPVPQSKPAERAPRRAAQAPPPVTFQPPSGDESPAARRKATPRKAAPVQAARKATAGERDEPVKAEPVKAEPVKAEPVKAEPVKAEPVKAEPVKAEPVKAEPVKAEPVTTTKAGPEKKAPVKAAKKAEPAAPTTPVKAAKATPAKKAARKATKAPAKKAAPPVQRQPVPSAAETETVSLPAEEAAAQIQAEEPTTPAQAQPPTQAEPKQAQPPTQAEPKQAEPKQARPTAQAGTTAPPAREAPRTDAWAKIVADPGHAPELLAVAATQTIGPRAREWARRTRADYPAATQDAVARLAVAQFTRAGGVSSIFAAVAGSYSPIALLGVNAFTYAELILHVAAAYGQDPTDPQRAVDLLVLTGVHPSAEDAEAALTTARHPAYEEDARLTDAVTRLGRMAAAQAAAWTVLKGVNRYFPGTAVLAAIIFSRSGSRTMGAKATSFYRGQS